MNDFFTEVFDSAILYEGEHALLWLIEALNGDRTMVRCRTSCRDETGVHLNPEVYTEKTQALPLPDFDGLPLDHYFVPERIIPTSRRVAATGAAARRPRAGLLRSISRHAGPPCGGADRGAARQVQLPAFPLHSDESYPPALFKKVSQMLVDQNVGIKWTTLIRFRETLQDQAVWDLAAKAGCCTLYYGMESANERVLNLMDKHAKNVIRNSITRRRRRGSGTT
ncbi:MAG: hypothetical protein U0361_04480 [Nitrospiraceae bacterium]